MKNIIEKIQYRFKSANIVEQIIYINVALFLLTYLINSVSFLMSLGDTFVFDWFSLPANFENFISKPWTIITYGFLHGGFLHILFNLIVLFYFGNLFLDFFSKKEFLIYYFSGIIVGGIIFMLSYSYFPALKNDHSFLVGASAGVTSILVGIATKIPGYALHFRFIGAIKLWYIAVGFILLDIVQIPISNTGGHLAHLGGALIGFILTNQFYDVNHTTGWFPNLFKSNKQKPLKTVYKKPRKTTNTTINTDAQQLKIDQILDKISKSGYETLTKDEKEFLFSVGKK
jgi:membrane associated rhomboid family serine protease